MGFHQSWLSDLPALMIVSLIVDATMNGWNCRSGFAEKLSGKIVGAAISWLISPVFFSDYDLYRSRDHKFQLSKAKRIVPAYSWVLLEV